VSSPVRATVLNEASGYLVMHENWFTGAEISPAVAAVIDSFVRSIMINGRPKT